MLYKFPIKNRQKKIRNVRRREGINAGWKAAKTETRKEGTKDGKKNGKHEGTMDNEEGRS